MRALSELELYAFTCGHVTIPLGILLGMIYERTKSLWIPVAIHYLFNIIPFLVR